MRSGQLVKLKPNSMVDFGTPSGAVPFHVSDNNCFGIVLGFYSYSGTYEVLLDGEVCFNVYPDSLEAV